MKRYIAITILGLALLLGNIWHNTVEAQRISRFVEGIVLTHATDPYLDVIDLTNSAQIRLKALDTSAEIGTESNHDLHFVTNSAQEMTILAAGNVGIGTTSPAAGLHVVTSDSKILFSTTETDATQKFLHIGTPHYTNAEEPLFGFRAVSNETSSEVSMGGGWTNGNAATELKFYTAANNTTTTGTERVRITSGGRLLVTDLAGVGFLSDVNTYIYTIGSDEINFHQGGALEYDFTTTKLELYGNFLEMNEIASPGGAANQARMFTRDNGGTTEVCFVFPGGDLVCHADPVP